MMGRSGFFPFPKKSYFLRSERKHIVDKLGGGVKLGKENFWTGVKILPGDHEFPQNLRQTDRKPKILTG